MPEMVYSISSSPPASDSVKKITPVQCSLWGIGRGLLVQALICPLEAVKIRQQCHLTPEKSFEIARTILQKEGMIAFYRGLLPQLIKTSIQQAWVWPLIAGLSVHLKRYDLGEIQQQALMGLFIATVDAAITTPLERAKILSAFSKGGKFSLQDGWKGSSTYWAKLSVHWVVFFMAQKILTDHYRGSSKEELSCLQLIKIGMQTAVIVSLVSAPFDTANTLKQAQNLSMTHLFSQNAFCKLYRGWPLSLSKLTIHSLASVIVIHKIGSEV